MQVVVGEGVRERERGERAKGEVGEEGKMRLYGELDGTVYTSMYILPLQNRVQHNW